jgi:3-oxoacyl-[acyl-carrier-protein] synthase III
MAANIPRILGAGYAVPAAVRTNDDPVFDWLKHHPPSQNPFQGYVDRRVLSEGEDLMTIMVPAALQSLEAAGVEPSAVDLLLGTASVSDYWNPNELCRLHELLALPQRAWVIPLNNEFSNFHAGMLMADGMIRAGRIRCALIVAGGNWTRHVSYHTVQSVSAGDGAGAAVLASSDDASRWTILDQETITQSQYYGSMFMQGERVDDQGRNLWTDSFFQITPEGFQGFGAFGVGTAPKAVLNILERQNLKGNDIALIAHQASQVLYDAWTKAIQPGQLIQTIQQFANMTVANNPVNLAYAIQNGSIQRDRLALLALGPDMHANAILLGRNE